MPISALGSIFGGGFKLSFIPRSHIWAYRMAKDKALQPTHADIGSAKVAQFGKRQIAIFNQHLIHGGESYCARNARLHVYGHIPRVSPLQNATMSPWQAFGERGRVFDRDSHGEWIL